VAWRVAGSSAGNGERGSNAAATNQHEQTAMCARKRAGVRVHALQEETKLGNAGSSPSTARYGQSWGNRNREGPECLTEGRRWKRTWVNRKGIQPLW